MSGDFALQRARFRTGIYGGFDVSGRDIPLAPRSLAVARGWWNAEILGLDQLRGGQLHVRDPNGWILERPDLAVAELARGQA